MTNPNGLFLAGFTPTGNYPTECPSTTAYCQNATSNTDQDGFITHFALDENIVLSEGKQIEDNVMEIIFYPNPSADFVQFSSNNISSKDRYQVFDNCGRLVMHGNFMNGHILNVAALSSGQYNVRIIAENNIYNVCFIKQ